MKQTEVGGVTGMAAEAEAEAVAAERAAAPPPPSQRRKQRRPAAATAAGEQFTTAAFSLGAQQTAGNQFDKPLVRD